MNKDQLVALLSGLAKVIGSALAVHGLSAASAIVTAPDVIESVAGLIIAIVSFYASHKYNASTPVSNANPAPPPQAGGSLGLFILLGMIGSLLFLAACSTTSTVVINPNGTSTTNTVTQFDANKTVQIMGRVIPQAVVYANKTAPQYRVHIVDAQLAACGLVGSTNVTPDNLKVVFAQTGITSIQTPEIEDAVATIYGLYSDFYDQLVAAHLPQDQIVTNMTVILHGVCDSLTLGLAQSP